MDKKTSINQEYCESNTTITDKALQDQETYQQDTLQIIVNQTTFSAHHRGAFVTLSRAVDNLSSEL